MVKLAKWFNEVFKNGKEESVKRQNNEWKSHLEAMVTLTKSRSMELLAQRTTFFADDQNDDDEQGPRRPTIPAHAGLEAAPTNASALHDER